MENLLKKHNTLLLILVIIVLFFIIVFGLITIRNFSSKKTGMETPVYGNTPPRYGQEAKREEFSSTRDIVALIENYIAKTYPEATNIDNKIEYVGAGYGFIKTTFSFNGQENSRNLYLEFNEPEWRVLYEDDEIITCAKVRELISKETVLSSLCK